MNNFLQVGRIIECGHCFPLKFALPTNGVCECVCHDVKENTKICKCNINGAETDIGHFEGCPALDDIQENTDSMEEKLLEINEK